MFRKVNIGLVACAGGECGLCDLLKTGENIFFWLLSIAFGLAVLFAVVSGFVYIFSLGKPSTKGAAKRALTFSIIGFIICLLSWMAIHAVYNALGYRGGSWWQINCDLQNTTQTGETENVTDLYANEVSPGSLGGRNNPIALPDFSIMGLSNIPDNKYFFIHGLGGQPLSSASEQLLKLLKQAKDEGKTMYAVIPYKNPKTGDIESSNLLNLNQYIGLDDEQTLKNIKNLVVQMIIESPTSNFPLIITGSKGSGIAKFNNVWPNEIDPQKGLATFTSEGVLYKEKEINSRQNEDEPNSSYFSINLTYDPNTNEYYLDRENPLTFDFPQNISLEAARETAINIAQVVAESAKYSQNMGKDEWDQVANLIVKDPKFLAGFSGADESVYNSGAFPSGLRINPGQTRDLDNLERAEKELEKIGKSVIDDRLGEPAATSKRPTASSSPTKNKPENPNPVETTPTSANQIATRQDTPNQPIPISGSDLDLISPPSSRRNQGSTPTQGGQKTKPDT
ncbi:MAG: pilin, partial [Candidatus Moraniibacteriota bacterium]